MTQHEELQIIEDYKNGKTLSFLVSKYHHRFEKIKEILAKNKILIDSRRLINKKHKELPDAITEKIIDNYINKKMGLKASGEEYNVGAFAVKSILLRNGYSIRTQKESATVSNEKRRKYFCNIDYFKNVTPNMAYILGFLASDGTVRLKENQIKLTLSKKDDEILKRIKDELEYTGPLYYATTNDGFDIVTLAINCKEYKEDLAIFNIVPQKTFTFCIPDTLPKEVWKDFIRGYWDGDGTVCTAGKGSIRSSLCSANKKTLEQILTFLEKEYSIPKVSIYKNQSGLYYFQYSTNSTKKLYKVFYDNAELFLQRKKDKFDELIQRK